MDQDEFIDRVAQIKHPQVHLHEEVMRAYEDLFDQLERWLKPAAEKVHGVKIERSFEELEAHGLLGDLRRPKLRVEFPRRSQRFLSVSFEGYDLLSRGVVLAQVYDYNEYVGEFTLKRDDAGAWRFTTDPSANRPTTSADRALTQGTFYDELARHMPKRQG